MPAFTTESGHQCQLDDAKLRASQPTGKGGDHTVFSLPGGGVFEAWKNWAGTFINAAQLDGAEGSVSDNWSYRNVARHVKTNGMRAAEGINNMRGVYARDSDLSYELMGKALAKMGVTACADAEGNPDVPVLTAKDVSTLKTRTWMME
jgi:hypothetical protein